MWRTTNKSAPVGTKQVVTPRPSCGSSEGREAAQRNHSPHSILCGIRQAPPTYVERQVLTIFRLEDHPPTPGSVATPAPHSLPRGHHSRSPLTPGWSPLPVPLPTPGWSPLPGGHHSRSPLTPGWSPPPLPTPGWSPLPLPTHSRVVTTPGATPNSRVVTTPV
jgi:hypothetical protein